MRARRPARRVTATEPNVAHLTYLLHDIWLNLEVCRDVTTENASFERFDVSADIGLGRQHMSFIRHTMWIFMSIRHDDMCLIRFDLWH